MKRFFDIVLTSFAVLVLSPLLVRSETDRRALYLLLPGTGWEGS